jgi:transcription-repair coupling factor (superfamily II helicase)
VNSETLPEQRAAAGVELAVSALLADQRTVVLARRLGSAARVTARVSEPLLAVLLAAVQQARRDEPRPAVSIIVADDEEARELAESIRAFTGAVPVAYYPHRGVDWGSPLAPAVHLVGERARALATLAEGGIVCVAADAIVERIPPREDRPAPVRVARGDQLDRDALLACLVEAGYERVGGTVEERGQVSARGDVVDVFPTTGREPIRIEFFGDDVERVCAFSSLTQRSLRDLDHAVLHPARERCDEDPAARFVAEDDADIPRDLVSVVPELLAAGVLVVWQPHQVQAAFDERWSEVGFGSAARRRGYLGERDLAELVETLPAFDPLPQGQSFTFEAQRPALAARGVAEAENELRSLVRQDLRVLVAFSHRGDAERAQGQLRRVDTVLANAGDPLRAGGGVMLVVSRVRRGFVSTQLRVAVLPAAQLLRRRSTGTATPIGRAIGSSADLKSGDYVVHEDHGVGRFVAFDTKTVAGVTRDYLCLDFKGDDKLFVPHEQIAKVSRYIGTDGRAPALSRLGGKAWQALKARARHAVHELAGELLALYAARLASEKQPVEPDGDLSSQLDATFPYAETDDQARTIEAVKADLESPRPMDRLVCGDVGFGKTEVAMRAAAKVVESGRQVLMLCPTTILAQQHYATFRDRFRDTAVEVDVASRFRASAALRETVSRFREGRIDILIGTHRVLSRDVAASNLGLVIVDEEQRFGVAQKELLRQMRTEVDVLALSATPIPRTLHMSLAGLRDISVIATPPRGRRPVRTHVGEWDDQLVAHALSRELARSGQAFYLHNRVESIDEAAERLRQLVPHARIAVAHGKMNERQLEGVMERFLHGDYDVLCATTIIEAGLDIPAANTLIIERADTLGLSQLYQIRGRVGRSDQAAFAYLFYPDASALTEEAAARLAALADYTELGAGFKVAMRDLELRGAGSLLGDEQSGHVAAVGFELYCELLAEAVAELQGVRHDQQATSVRVDAAVDAFVPAAYVGLESAKIDVHRRIALAGSEDELRDLEAELADRFGPVPEPVANLIGIQAVRLALASFGMVAVAVRRDRVVLSGVPLSADETRALRELVTGVTSTPAKREVAVRVGDQPAVQAARGLVAGIVEVRRGPVTSLPLSKVSASPTR